MTGARVQGSHSTSEFPFFFDAVHAAVAERADDLAAQLHDDEERRADPKEISLAQRCSAIAANLATADLLGAVVPQHWGGHPNARPGAIDVRTVCLIRETLAWASPLAEFVFAMQGLGSYPIVLAGSDELRAEFLPPVLSGKSLAAFAITESEAGSDVASMQTRARRDGGHYVIDGGKVLISNAGFAGHYVVFAKTAADAGSKGISAFVVKPTDPGFVFEGATELLAEHPVGSLRFEGLRVPESRRLGAEGDGFKIAMSTLDTFRCTVAAGACGMAARALDVALCRANARRQFGQSIGEFQIIKGYLADMATELDAARLLVYRAAHARDAGAERITVEAAEAKLFATETAQRIIDRAVQIHGGSGLVRGHVLESLYREIRALRIYEGTTEIQKVVIGGALLAGERARVAAAIRGPRVGS